MIKTRLAPRTPGIYLEAVGLLVKCADLFVCSRWPGFFGEVRGDYTVWVTRSIYAIKWPIRDRDTFQQNGLCVGV